LEKGRNYVPPIPLLKILPPLALSELFARPLCIFRKGTPSPLLFPIFPPHCKNLLERFKKKKKTFSILFGSCRTLGYIEWGFLILNVGSLNLVKENHHPFSDILCYYNCNPFGWSPSKYFYGCHPFHTQRKTCVLRRMY